MTQSSKEMKRLTERIPTMVEEMSCEPLALQQAAKKI